MVFLEDSIFLNLVNGEREHKNYGITHTIPYKLVDEQLFGNLINSYVTTCRICGQMDFVIIITWFIPIANNLNENKDETNDLYPLDLNYCDQCFNSQLSVVVPPKKMFDSYLYLSSTSQIFKDHFSEIANELKNTLKLKNPHPLSLILAVMMAYSLNH